MCFNVSVISFLYILTEKFIKLMEKKQIKQKQKSLNFAESKAHRKTNAHDSFETQNYFLALYGLDEISAHVC